MVDDKMLLISDAGRLVLLDPNPATYRELASAKGINGKVWSRLACRDDQLFLRSTTKGVCLEL